MRRSMVFLLLIGFLGVADSSGTDIYDFARRLGQGVNLGNALEAPREGAWGITLQSSDFQVIADGGFDSVRVPIRWSNHASLDSTNGVYEVDAAFFKRIDWVVDEAEQRDLAVVLNVHHYNDLTDEPTSFHRDRFLSLWDQIAQRYRTASETVYFELLNEPHDPMRDGDWNALLSDTLTVVRRTNPNRPVVIGGTGWNSVTKLDALKLPADDRNIIGTFHYYSPFEFTHQGAEWVEGSDAWLGVTWAGLENERDQVTADFDKAVQWATENDRPVYLGEFGAYSKGDTESRSAWTSFVAAEAEARGIPWAYWEYGAGFGVYDRDEDQWISETYDALSIDATLPLLEVSVACDFDGAGGCDATDLDLLTGLGDLSAGILLVAGSNERFDINQDGRINTLDVDRWLENAAIRNGFAESYQRGDANLDGFIDGSDFNRWSVNNFTLGRTWSEGDFDSDGDVDIVDFFTWNRNKFNSIPPASFVPEPSGFFPFLFCGFLPLAKDPEANERKKPGCISRASRQCRRSGERSTGVDHFASL